MHSNEASLTVNCKYHGKTTKLSWKFLIVLKLKVQVNHADFIWWCKSQLKNTSILETIKRRHYILLIFIALFMTMQWNKLTCWKALRKNNFKENQHLSGFSRTHTNANNQIKESLILVESNDDHQSCRSELSSSFCSTTLALASKTRKALCKTSLH